MACKKAKFQSVDAEKWANESIDDLHGHKSGISEAFYAALQGCFSILPWLYSQNLLNMQMNNFLGSAQHVATKGRVDILNWLHLQGFLVAGSEKNPVCALFTMPHLLGSSVAQFAAQYNKVEVLKWMQSRGIFDPAEKDGRGKSVAHYASLYGSLDVLKWLYFQDMLDLKDTIDDGKDVLALASPKVLPWLKSLEAPTPSFMDSIRGFFFGFHPSIR